MRKFEVSFSYSKVFEAEDAGEALMKADIDFSVMSDADVVEIEDEEEPPCQK